MTRDRNADTEPSPGALRAAKLIHELILKQMAPITDRARIIVAYSNLETALRTVVEARIQARRDRRTSGAFEKHLGFDGVFGSSKAKLMLAYATGVLGSKSYREIDTLRELRNLFAHNECFPNVPKKYEPYGGQHVDCSHPYIERVIANLGLFDEMFEMHAEFRLPKETVMRYEAAARFYEFLFRELSTAIDAIQLATDSADNVHLP